MDDLGRLGFSEEQGDLLDVAQAFCRDRSPIDRVRALIADDLGHDPAIWSEIADLGWLGVAIPEIYGGSGLGLAEVVPIVEAMGRHLMQTPYVSTVLAAEVLRVAGTDAQRAAWLPRIAGGAAASLALSEAYSGWRLDAVETQLAGGRLSGTKRLVADAAAAELLIASAKQNGAVVLCLIEREAIPAEALRREKVVDETKRSYEVTFDGLAVGPDAILASAPLDHVNLTANLLSAAEMAGATQAAIDYTVEYLTTRKQFGKLIGSYQSLKHPTVDNYVAWEQARSHVYAAAHCFNEQGTGEIATRMAKVSTLTALANTADRAIQFHGGFGFTYDCDAQLYRRRAIWHAAQYGDAGYHKRRLADLLLT